MGDLVLLFIIGHLLADFPFQKNQLKLTQKQIAKHIFIHFAVNLLLGASFLFHIDQFNWEIILRVFYAILIICFIHWIIDIGKEHVIDLIDEKENNLHIQMILHAIVYVLDQILHITIIVGTVSLVFGQRFHLYQSLDLMLANRLTLTFDSQVLLTVIVVLLNLFFVGYFIGLVLGYFKPDNDIIEKIETERIRTVGEISESERIVTNRTIQLEEQPTKAGDWIGAVERMITLVLVLVNSLFGIMMLVLVKAIARHKQFEDKTYTDHFLVGSFISLLCSLVLGYFLKFVWGFDFNF